MTIEELFIHVPVIGAGPERPKPAAEVSGDGVEVGPQAIREKQRHPAWFERELEVVEEGIGS